MKRLSAQILDSSLQTFYRRLYQLGAYAWYLMPIYNIISVKSEWSDHLSTLPRYRPIYYGTPLVTLFLKPLAAFLQVSSETMFKGEKAKGSLNSIFQDSINKILSQQLTHDRSYISHRKL